MRPRFQLPAAGRAPDCEQLLERVDESLIEQGLLLKQGTILDATIINAPSSTKNKKGERDPEMYSVAKGNQWFFGMRCFNGVDADSGLVHSVVNTAANVHELNTAADRVHGEEGGIDGDSGHIGIGRREGFERLRRPDAHRDEARPAPVSTCCVSPRCSAEQLVEPLLMGTTAPPLM